MNKEEFYRFLYHPELLDDRSLPVLQQILEEYPYFQSARLLHIKNLSNQGNIQYEKELKKTAVWITDRNKLFFLLDKRVLLPVSDTEIKISRSNIHENQNETLDFEALLKITEFPEAEPESYQTSEKENDELDLLIMTGSAQSSTFFEVDDKINLEEFKNTFKKKKPETQQGENPEYPEDRRKKLIDTFIFEQPKIVPREEKEPIIPSFGANKTDESPEMITDTLAKIYVKQGFYEKAVSAYEKLSLKYPEKNSYFATQIGKIKQIINNQ
ncbi:MAG TPA: hypothetical protein DCQ26_17920 [Marinilabiliales bacterium]|nr:MAG: hypothetical protein A2W84_04380 [Bacteroidetes bacterium GWC2_40_13]OFX73520.1 MAG: hypothetical protein A2W96_02510 [Bacteroidetes bacterium GWD2_40_43]OFX90804.1 MAG: hypothetical protein A2W97_03535 [Bacteroidetes bacterium GWE2_40_63]OFY20564.1 MAG: hypothetical protein A2W88_13305 [Bacteroidetes bacterium GWF2_40_13]OFZ24114.1 MAG: hypothetical protein A2437_10830 [Bacteroidetes bacterium RIFOXYC2_FULL_40_12]HAN00474.1 hypothetical protein [Marinilabiliales bacterium]